MSDDERDTRAGEVESLKRNLENDLQELKQLFRAGTTSRSRFERPSNGSGAADTSDDDAAAAPTPSSSTGRASRRTHTAVGFSRDRRGSSDHLTSIDERRRNSLGGDTLLGLGSSGADSGRLQSPRRGRGAGAGDGDSAAAARSARRRERARTMAVSRRQRAGLDNVFDGGDGGAPSPRGERGGTRASPRTGGVSPRAGGDSSASMQRRVEELEAERADLVEQIGKGDARRRRLMADMEKMGEDADRLREDLETNEHEKDDLVRGLNQLLDSVTQMEDLIVKGKEIKAARRPMRTVRRKGARQALADVDTMVAKYTELLTLISTYASSESQANTLRALCMVFAQLSSKLNVVTTVLQRLEGNFSDARGELASKGTMAPSTTKQVGDELSSLGVQTGKLITMIQAMERLAKRTMKKWDDLQSSSGGDKMKKTEWLAEMLRKEEEKRKEAEATVARLEEEMRAGGGGGGGGGGDSSPKAADVEQLERELEQQREDAAAAVREVDELNERVEALLTEKDEIERQFKRLTTQSERRGREIELERRQWEDERTEAEDQRDQLREELDSANTQLKFLMDEQDSSKEDDKAAKRDQMMLEKVKARLESTQDEVDRLTAELEDAHDALAHAQQAAGASDAVAQLEEELQARCDLVAQLEDDAVQHDVRVAQLEDEVAARDARVAELEGDVVAAEDRARAAEKKARTANSGASADVARLEAVVEHQQERLDELEAAEDAAARHAADLKEAKETLRAAQVEAKKANKALERSKENEANLRAQLDEAKAAAKKAKKSGGSSATTTTTTGSSSSGEEARVEIQALQDEVSALEEQISLMQEDATQHAKQVSELVKVHKEELAEARDGAMVSDKVLAEREERQRFYERMYDQLDALEQEKYALLQHIEQMEEERMHTEAERADMAEKVCYLMKIVCAFDEADFVAKAGRDDLTHALTLKKIELEEKVRDEQRKYRHVRQELRVKDKQLKGTTTKYEQLLQTYDALVSERDGQDASLGDMVGHLTKALRDIEEHLFKIEEDVDRVKEQLNFSDGELSEKDEEDIVFLENEAELVLKSSENRIRGITQNVTRLVELMQGIDDVGQRLSAKKVVGNEANAVRKAEAAAAELEKQVAELRERARTEASRSVQLAGELEERQRSLDAAATEKRRMLSELIELKAKGVGPSVSASATHGGAAGAGKLEGELKKLKRELESEKRARKTAEEELDTSAFELIEAQERVAELESGGGGGGGGAGGGGASAEELNKLQDEVDELQFRIEEETIARSEAEEKAEQLESEVNELQLEAKRLKRAAKGAAAGGAGGGDSATAALSASMVDWAIEQLGEVSAAVDGHDGVSAACVQRLSAPAADELRGSADDALEAVVTRLSAAAKEVGRLAKAHAKAAAGTTAAATPTGSAAGDAAAVALPPRVQRERAVRKGLDLSEEAVAKLDELVQSLFVSEAAASKELFDMKRDVQDFITNELHNRISEDFTDAQVCQAEIRQLSDALRNDGAVASHGVITQLLADAESCGEELSVKMMEWGRDREQLALVAQAVAKQPGELPVDVMDMVEAAVDMAHKNGGQAEDKEMVEACKQRVEEELGKLRHVWTLYAGQVGKLSRLYKVRCADKQELHERTQRVLRELRLVASPCALVEDVAQAAADESAAGPSDGADTTDWSELRAQLDALHSAVSEEHSGLGDVKEACEEATARATKCEGEMAALEEKLKTASSKESVTLTDELEAWRKKHAAAVADARAHGVFLGAGGVKVTTLLLQRADDLRAQLGGGSSGGGGGGGAGGLAALVAEAEDLREQALVVLENVRDGMQCDADLVRVRTQEARVRNTLATQARLRQANAGEVVEAEVALLGGMLPFLRALAGGVTAGHEQLPDVLDELAEVNKKLFVLGKMNVSNDADLARDKVALEQQMNNRTEALHKARQALQESDDAVERHRQSAHQLLTAANAVQLTALFNRVDAIVAEAQEHAEGVAAALAKVRAAKVKEDQGYFELKTRVRRLKASSDLPRKTVRSGRSKKSSAAAAAAGEGSTAPSRAKKSPRSKSPRPARAGGRPRPRSAKRSTKDKDDGEKKSSRKKK